VPARLDHLKIDCGDIACQRRIPRRDMYGRIVAYNAWFWFQSCSGNLVVQLNRRCQIRQAYWRGDCSADARADGDEPQCRPARPPGWSSRAGRERALRRG
jgi:hypothetical protein